MKQSKTHFWDSVWIVRRTIFTCCKVCVGIVCFSMRPFLISLLQFMSILSSGDSPLDHLVSKNQRKKGDPSYFEMFQSLASLSFIYLTSLVTRDY